MTRSGIEPGFPRSLANTLTIMTIIRHTKIKQKQLTLGETYHTYRHTRACMLKTTCTQTKALYTLTHKNAYTPRNTSHTHTQVHIHTQKHITHTHTHTHTYIYIYIYRRILSPVKPELGVIPSGQEIIHE